MEHRPYEKLIVAQLVNKFPTVYRTRKFITIFTRARYWSLSRSWYIRGCIQKFPDWVIKK